MADPGELFVLLKNLVENAVDHSPPGGTVRISLSQGGLCVDDEGKGVAEHQRQQVFERFWRAPDNTKPGSGLGLAICMEVARAHGWLLGCGPSALGGAQFKLDFQAATATPRPSPRRPETAPYNISFSITRRPGLACSAACSKARATASVRTAR